MTINTKTHPAVTLEIKGLVAALAIESFNFRENVAVNVVTNARTPFINVYVYINDVSVESFLITLTDDDAEAQLKHALDQVLHYKRQDKSFGHHIKLAS